MGIFHLLSPDFTPEAKLWYWIFIRTLVRLLVWVLALAQMEHVGLQIT